MGLMLRARLATTTLFNLVAAFWVLHDARRRHARKPAFAAALAFLWGPLGVAFWVADRPLTLNERRVGGTGWVMARTFVLAWLALLPALFVLVGPVVAENAAIPGSLGRRFGLRTATLLVTSVVWCAPAALAVALGSATRERRNVERGSSATQGRSLPMTAALVLSGAAALACALSTQ
jgi:hypothetical protein